MLSHWAYILIGNDQTGKTSFQKNMIWTLCQHDVSRLDTNRIFQVKHDRMPQAIKTLSCMNRSFQEKLASYINVETFFQHHFGEADIPILSSHTDGRSKDDIESMISQLKLRCYNVAAVFFSNGFDDDARQISLLDWNERLWLSNPLIETNDSEQIATQVYDLSVEFCEFIIARSRAN